MILNGAISSLTTVIPTKLDILPPSLITQPFEQKQISVLIGLVGSIKGRLIIDTTKDVISTIGQSMFGMAIEGERELSSIVRDFQQKRVQVLCSYNLWEGLDIPQDALTRVIIHDLPFPPADPLFDARRQHAGDSFKEVDLPYMLLRLRQGAGRLIRTSADSGTVHLLLDQVEQQMKSEIEGVFPVKMKMMV